MPTDLVEILGKKEIKKSLGTADLKKARRKITLEALKVEEIFEAARRGRDARKLSDLTETEIERLVLVNFHSTEQASARRDDLYTLSDEERNQVEENLGYEQYVLTSGDESSGYLADVQEVADQILIDDGFGERRTTPNSKLRRAERVEADVDKTSPQYQDLCRLVHRAILEHSKRTLIRLRGENHGTSYDPLFAGIDPNSPPSISSVASITISELVEEYLSEPDQRAVTDKTRAGRRAMYRVLVDVLGRDTPITEITRVDMRSVRDMLMRLPPNTSKRFPDLT